MYKYNIEKIIDCVKNIKLSKKDRIIALSKTEYGIPVLVGIFFVTLIAIAIPCFSIYIINWKSIVSCLSSSIFITSFLYYFLLFSNKNNFFSEKAKKYIICKEEINEYLASLPEKYKDDAIKRLADQTWSNGGNLSAKGFFDVYNYFLPSIKGLNEKIFKDDFITSFSNKQEIVLDKKTAVLERK